MPDFERPESSPQPDRLLVGSLTTIIFISHALQNIRTDRRGLFGGLVSVGIGGLAAFQAGYHYPEIAHAIGQATSTTEEVIGVDQETDISIPNAGTPSE